ncbi:MAG: phosphatidylglycerol lysyltransferase domain-containing protein [Candidatus Omnitrophica bacterium]|nr:phosphatidylglycerol lysyltransferase domain-containing protein [Candidatus Omnitrophota bacterium]
MRLSRITLARKDEIDRSLALRKHSLAAYSFSSIYIWKKFYNLFSAPVEGNCCVFLKDNLGCFAYLAPLGGKLRPAAVEGCFKIMDRFNSHRALSRIENVEEEDLDFFHKLGYVSKEKPGDYICKREVLAALKGDRFKSKRASCNFFAANYDFRYRPFEAKDKKEAIRLYRRWAKQRAGKFSDKIYLGMIQDSLLCQVEAMDGFKALGLLGRVIEIERRMAAYTIGYPLNRETFCVLFETTDLSVKGAAQYIFRRFCEELEYEYINIMDDSGLENLKKVKLSYHPFKTARSYIIKRPDV